MTQNCPESNLALEDFILQAYGILDLFTLTISHPATQTESKCPFDWYSFKPVSMWILLIDFLWIQDQYYGVSMLQRPTVIISVNSIIDFEHWNGIWFESALFWDMSCVSCMVIMNMFWRGYNTGHVAISHEAAASFSWIAFWGHNFIRLPHQQWYRRLHWSRARKTFWTSSIV